LSQGSANGYRFKPLAEDCRREALSCGVRDIDTFFRKKAWDHHCALRCRVTTVHDAADDTLAGFYAVCITLEDDRFLDRRSHLKKFSIGRYFPALQVHYVAVRTQLQGRGIGTIVMGRIVGIFRDAAESLGVPVMTLVVLNPGAAALYKRMGFVYYGGHGSSRMLLPAQSVLDLPPAP
jgi:ribosomal protein S18 acetylase RimI-like enzyme